MTNLEALQAMVEYSNDNLLIKTLADRSISASSNYSATHQQGVELAAADIYLILMNHPDFREGSKYINYSKSALMVLRFDILKKWNALPDTINTPGIGLETSNPSVW